MNQGIISVTLEDLFPNMWNSKIDNVLHFELCFRVGVKQTSDAPLLHSSLVLSSVTRVENNKRAKMWKSKIDNFGHLELCVGVGAKQTSDATLYHNSQMMNRVTRVKDNKIKYRSYKVGEY